MVHKFYQNLLNEPCNLSGKLGSFPNHCKIATLKPLFRKGPKLTLQITGQYCYYLQSPKSSKNLSMNKQVVFYLTMKSYTTIVKNQQKFYTTDSCLTFLPEMFERF